MKPAAAAASRPTLLTRKRKTTAPNSSPATALSAAADSSSFTEDKPIPGCECRCLSVHTHCRQYLRWLAGSVQLARQKIPLIELTLTHAHRIQSTDTSGLCRQ